MNHSKSRKERQKKKSKNQEKYQRWMSGYLKLCLLKHTPNTGEGLKLWEMVTQRQIEKQMHRGMDEQQLHNNKLKLLKSFYFICDTSTL